MGRDPNAHTVAAKFDPAPFKVLEELAKRHNKKPGPFVSDFMLAYLATVQIDDMPNQEALPIELVD